MGNKHKLTGFWLAAVIVGAAGAYLLLALFREIRYWAELSRLIWAWLTW